MNLSFEHMQKTAGPYIGVCTPWDEYSAALLALEGWQGVDPGAEVSQNNLIDYGRSKFQNEVAEALYTLAADSGADEDMAHEGLGWYALFLVEHVIMHESADTGFVTVMVLDDEAQTVSHWEELRRELFEDEDRAADEEADALEAKADAMVDEYKEHGTIMGQVPSGKRR